MLVSMSNTLQAPLVKSYTKVTNIVPRRETIPFSMSFVLSLEQFILEGRLSPADLLQRGALLVLIWASLRWADAQWVSPTSLQIHQDTLIGAAARTKTTSRSMPFGIYTGGLLGRDTTAHWAQVWFNILVQALTNTKQRFPTFEPDFLVCETGPDPAFPVFQSAMSRSRGLQWIRQLLREHLMASNISPSWSDLRLIGVHSAKVTILSWARQLCLDEESRRLQGHHRGSSASHSVQLYARDDAFPAIQLQKKICMQAALGFRPVCAVNRGAEPPLQDTVFKLPAWPGVMDDVSSRQAVAVAHAIAAEPDVDSSSSSSTAGGSDSELGHPTDLGEADEILLLANPHSSVVHCAQLCELQDPLFVHQSDDGKCFKTCCGARPTALDEGLILCTAVPMGSRLCSRFGCVKSRKST